MYHYLREDRMNRSKHDKSLKCIVFLVCVSSLLFAGPWPGTLPGVEIGSGLPAGYEPSGAVWHIQLHKFFTVWDNGMVSMMDYDGTNITTWSVYGDLEGICVANPQGDFVYVGVEGPDDGIAEFNVQTGQATRFFDLTPWMQSIDPNLGLEALTFVPDTASSEGGYFYAGLQQTGTIYMFELPILSSSSDTTVTFIDSIHTGLPGISGLDYNTEGGLLYAMWRFLHQLRVMSPDGSILTAWDLPGDSQEGVALWEGLTPGQAQIFVAEDNGEVWRYDFNSQCIITIIGNGSVNLVPDPPGYYGTTDTLTAIPDTGYQFVQWSGDLTGSENPAVLLMDYDKNVTATFESMRISEYATSEPIDPHKHLGTAIFSGPLTLPEGKKCKVFDITGRVVEPTNITRGIYFVEIDNEIVQKVVKIR
jgi:WD40 repeat protein